MGNVGKQQPAEPRKFQIPEDHDDIDRGTLKLMLGVREADINPRLDGYLLSG